MDNSQSTIDYPWEVHDAPTQIPPGNDLPDYPWETHSAQQPADVGVFGKIKNAMQIDARLAGTPNLQPGTTAPAAAFKQDVNGPGVQDSTVTDAANVYGLGSFGKAVATEGIPAVGEGAVGVVNKIKSFFETPESLKSAGIDANTLKRIAPGGQNPADYVKAVEQQLINNDALGTSAKETWDKMNPLKNSVGKQIGDDLATLKSSESAIDAKYGDVGNPTIVDAEKALQPISEKIAELGTGIYSDAQNMAKPYQQVYSGLLNMAKDQGGKLSLENIDSVLKQTGEMMDHGEVARETYGPIYGKLADVRDSMVHTIAQQSGNPEIAQRLLKNNADYSTYLRLLPTVERGAYKEAVKEGVSAYQKHIGPLGEKLAIAGGSYAVIREVLDKILGSGH